MKKILLFSYLSLLLILTSCSDNDFGGDDNIVQPVDFTVYVKYESSFNSLAVENAKVILTNTETGNKYTAESDKDGKTSFSKILPGTYVITATQELSKDTFNSLFGYLPLEEQVIFNGSQSNIAINVNATATNIEMNAAKIGDLVIKQIYYAGSDTKQGAAFRDQFVEIYNNSNTIQYADKLYLAILRGNLTNKVATYTLADGQFDWSQSEGMTIGDKANTDYVYASNVIQIPGNGTQYPINPGESIIIAQSAINHKSNYIDNSGNTISVLNPELTVDLSQADFDTYLGTYLGNSYRFDIQNPAVTDVTIAHWGNGFNDLILDVHGRYSYAIFKATDAEINSWGIYKGPSSTDTVLHLQIPNTVIIDGIDLTRDMGTNLVPKKFQPIIDGGRTYLTAGAYSSNSVIRKTKTTIAGRIVLQDTNNSTEDFVEIKTNPKGFAN